MVDKIVVLNAREAIVLFSNRSPVKITHDTDVASLLTWMKASVTLTLTEYTSAVLGLSEETSEITLEAA